MPTLVLLSTSPQCVQKALVEPYLAAAFPGQPCAVRFGFDFDEPPTAKEVFEIAAVAKQAGWSIDQQQLEEATGYTLVKDESAGAPGTSLPTTTDLRAAGTTVGADLRAARLPFLNKAPSATRPDASAPFPCPDASAPSDATGVLAAFARDTGPAADAIKAFLNDPSKAAADDLLSRLPSLLPEDPALVALIAEEMAKEFKEKE